MCGGGIAPGPPAWRRGALLRPRRGHVPRAHAIRRRLSGGLGRAARASGARGSAAARRGRRGVSRSVRGPARGLVGAPPCLCRRAAASISTSEMVLLILNTFLPTISSNYVF